MNAELILGEIEVMKTLSHPNIVLMKDVYQTNNNFYLILEFCNQGDLEQYMKKNQLDETGALQVFYQIVQGYEYLYLQNFMHRDLKPANIFFSNNSVKIGFFLNDS
jgi:serine/threonine protein kinase